MDLGEKRRGEKTEWSGGRVNCGQDVMYEITYGYEISDIKLFLWELLKIKHQKIHNPTDDSFSM